MPKSKKTNINIKSISSFETFSKKLVKKYSSEKNLVVLLDNVFKCDPDNKELLYSASWILIHSMHILDPFDQLDIFFKILRMFSQQNCICGQDAFVIIKSLFNDELKNFYRLNEYKQFWIYFHNLINLKLNKPVFKYLEMS
jgi:hypothetical protein